MSKPTEDTVTDGFTCWLKCGHPECGLSVVRYGKVQCWCDVLDEPTHEKRDELLARFKAEYERSQRVEEIQGRVLADNAEVFRELAEGDK